MTDFTYNISDGILKGSLDEAWFNDRAGSGGRSGSKIPGAVNILLANNPYATGIHGPGHAKGPLPQGTYQMVLHESRKHWIRLLPDKHNIMHGRDGFAIHGRGETGSHGCIVPADFSVVLKLCHLLEKRGELHRPAPKLAVIAVGADLDAKLRVAQRLA